MRVTKNSVVCEFRRRQLLLRRDVRRLRSRVVLYGVYREVGHNRLQSWAAAEREVLAVEWVENRKRADRFLFRLEVERDLASLQVSE